MDAKVSDLFIRGKILNIPHKDGFFETMYTSHTVKDIQLLYDKLKYNVICKGCNISNLDIKMVIKDNSTPTFVIVRKINCTSCWLKMIKS